MKRTRIIIMLLILLMLNGCGSRANVPFSESKAPPGTAAASETKDPDTGDDVSSQVVIRENPEETDSKKQNVKSDETAVIPDSKQPDEWTGSTETAFSQPVIMPVDEKIPEEPVSEEKAGTDPTEQEPAPEAEQENEPEQPPDSPQEPDQEPDLEPEAEPEPKPTEEPEPVFDIGYWTGYARNTAAGLGLELDSLAVECWDNPITANPDCIYLERDITARLSRYAGEEDITAVWIWYENVGTNRYLIYIGYA